MTKHFITITFILSVCFLNSCNLSKNASYQYLSYYTPDDKALYNTIVRMDSLFFAAYNTCDQNLETYAEFYADDIEFYHDQGGISTSKKDIIEATRKNICGKVTRHLVNGSVEVYPIKDFGAIEIGLHTFHNNTQKPGTPSKTGRFVVVWHHVNNQWKISRVASLH